MCFCNFELVNKCPLPYKNVGVFFWNFNSLCDEVEWEVSVLEDEFCWVNQTSWLSLFLIITCIRSLYNFRALLYLSSSVSSLTGTLFSISTFLSSVPSSWKNSNYNKDKKNVISILEKICFLYTFIDMVFMISFASSAVDAMLSSVLVFWLFNNFATKPQCGET